MNRQSCNSTIVCGALALVLFLLPGCAARQVQDSLAGSTAQKLVTYSIDDLAGALPDEHFEVWTDKRMFVSSSFLAEDDTESGLKRYADRRLALELARRFGIEVVSDA